MMIVQDVFAAPGDDLCVVGQFSQVTGYLLCTSTPGSDIKPDGKHIYSRSNC